MKEQLELLRLCHEKDKKYQFILDRLLSRMNFTIKTLVDRGYLNPEDLG